MAEMIPLQKALDSADDWSGLADAKERRKRQNRLHQRAWRRHRATEAKAAKEAATSGQLQIAIFDPSSLGSSSIPSAKKAVWLPSDTVSLSARSRHGQASDVSLRFSITEEEWNSKLVKPLIPYLTKETPQRRVPPLRFPLSPDHHLITLVQYNVLRAMLINMSILSLLGTLPDECGGALQLVTFSAPAGTTPPSLKPTVLQSTTPHHPWIDIMPSPRMRDNFITRMSEIDEDKLCDDTLGGLYDGYDDTSVRGVMVWQDPWLEESWEVTEGFAKRWGFLLKGCDRLLQSTNRWRLARGEEPLAIEV